jgi:hypothetical protein
VFSENAKRSVSQTTKTRPKHDLLYLRGYAEI